ncbi:MAG: hypothetical protein WBE37_32105 [Bryobacteraceae bacterium]|jgi:hypothetical protein
MTKFICSIAVVLLAAGFVVSAYGAGSYGFNTSHHIEPHPEIHYAINKLEHAKGLLQQTSYDYGGHRSKALDHVNAALSELHQALEYAEHVDSQAAQHHND